MALTRNEAHRRAIEAGARALAADHHVTKTIDDFQQRREYINNTWRRYEREAGVAITAYLAAMVLPIEEWDGETPCTFLYLENGNWIADAYNDLTTHFTFLPEPPK